jgi:protein-L-isoaspartate(D-aspartate) O-methyltransferase
MGCFGSVPIHHNSSEFALCGLAKLRNLSARRLAALGHIPMMSDTARIQMVRQQVRAWEVLDARVLHALSELPREHFAPAAYRDLAFADFEIPLDHGECMMAPNVEGKLLQALRLSPVDHVLEIGTGSGFLTACLARLAGSVLSVDIYPDFVESAQQKLSNLDIRNVTLNAQDGFRLQQPAQFDAIAVTGSVPELRSQFADMLRPGGRLFIVVGRPPIMEARLITRQEDGRCIEESLFETALKPLINADQFEPFSL